MCSVLQRVTESLVTLQLPEDKHNVLHPSRHLVVRVCRGQGAEGRGTAPPVPWGDTGGGSSEHVAGQCRGCWRFCCIHCTILSTLLQLLGSKASHHSCCLLAPGTETRHRAPPHRQHTQTQGRRELKGAVRVSRHPNLALYN